MGNVYFGGWFARLTVIGLFCFLCAPWLLQSNTHYHRLIIVFLWLPALLHVFLMRKHYPSMDKSFVVLYLMASAWFVFVSVLDVGRGGELREIKLPFYIGLSLLGCVVCAMCLRERFTGFLLLCCAIGGLGAGLSWFIFYFVQEHDFSERVVNLGLWRVVIPAAQACGALFILTIFLGFDRKRGVGLLCVLVLALLGFGVFIYFSQTRWVWLSLVLSCVGGAILLRNKLACGGAAIALLLIGAIFLAIPELLSNRGLSYRPEIWQGGFALLLDNWWEGVGSKEYWIAIKSTPVRFNHAHNMFLDIGIRFGVLGLLLWIGLWCWTGWHAIKWRHTSLGGATVALWLYSGLVVLTDGTMPWVKPSTIWFVTWLPVALVLAMDTCVRQGKEDRDFPVAG
ncbi:O-antigen ligase family protein [Pseudomonas sp. BN515]|uniref:O-antigen ligase family protein n=1 Tax=Pseudomonas sp. BN515 TaxID=2567892 RepID=UPI002457D8DC|nr:O-antigen ligase family protein [Pseudomonas sp. BN515]MDH4874738.1 O-antigen ligase family protein [Pseudomonas sp. BN515]